MSNKVRRTANPTHASHWMGNAPFYCGSKTFPLTMIIYEVVKANGTKSFSPVMVGQKWQVERLSKLFPTETREGWETASVRKYLRLIKDIRKEKDVPATHAVDGVALAASAFVRYKRFETKDGHGHAWFGKTVVTEAPFSVIRRPILFRRKLHVENFAKGGIRKRHGGTVTPFGFRKGDYVEAEKAGCLVRGYVSGFTEKTKLISVADHRWKRIGQFALSKVRLLQRSHRLLIKHMAIARI